MPRARFVKEGDAVWMSHLDLMRVLQRGFRRAGLLLAHSQGFTPHPELSLALPLSVGVSSVCEILDFKLEEGQDAENLCERLNRVLPAGVRILEVCDGGEKIKNLRRLRIEIALEYDSGVPEGAEAGILALFARKEIIFEKTTKSGTTVAQNLMDMMWNASVSEDADILRLTCDISAQDPALNPARITEAIARELPGYAPDFSAIRRQEALTEDGTAFR